MAPHVAVPVVAVPTELWRRRGLLGAAAFAVVPTLPSTAKVVFFELETEMEDRSRWKVSLVKDLVKRSATLIEEGT